MEVESDHHGTETLDYSKPAPKEAGVSSWSYIRIAALDLQRWSENCKRYVRGNFHGYCRSDRADSLHKKNDLGQKLQKSWTDDLERASPLERHPNPACLLHNNQWRRQCKVDSAQHHDGVHSRNGLQNPKAFREVRPGHPSVTCETLRVLTYERT